ncbi:nucleotidyltransferase domain-containing protein [Sphingomonas sp. RHCKR7]|uniref:nucleotidyltransferase family protein n=1 Tax=Sphingomonas folli TaxID=2862497 RepID=UPI001CA5DD3B|nr:nucleotidyltransferase domain-containing protein [Sphingomonas folli]MBW6526791.1 nucleotidyltransferase domain-containing protein [Sphingomonas folli]
MRRSEAIDLLRAREPELRALGICALSLFGSTARDEAREESDIDLAAALDYDTLLTAGPFAFFGLSDAIAGMVGRPVDLVTEPARKPALQDEIDRDRVRVY